MNKILKIIALELFYVPTAFALSSENEKQMYLDCCMDSKKYIAPERAKKYSSCAIQMLASEYSNEEIEKIFKKNLRKL